MTRWIRPLIATSLLAAFTLAQALTITPYTPQALATAQKAGQPVAVQFHAEWCPTCKLQEKALNQMVAEPGLDITVLVADYDKEKDLREQLNTELLELEERRANLLAISYSPITITKEPFDDLPF